MNSISCYRSSMLWPIENPAAWDARAERDSNAVMRIAESEVRFASLPASPGRHECSAVHRAAERNDSGLAA
jgi:hypothetical protein